MSCNFKIATTSPENVFEEKISIPRDADLPFSVQLYKKNAETDEYEPYDLNGHTVVFEIFQSQHSLEPLVEFLDEDWSREESPDQEDTPVSDILEKVILWEDHSELKNGVEYWWRFRATDAADVDFIIGRGVFFKEMY